MCVGGWRVRRCAVDVCVMCVRACVAANNIGDDGAAALAESLRVNTSLTSLDLWSACPPTAPPRARRPPARRPRTRECD